MATWDDDAELTHPLDYQLVRNSFITMFWRTTLLSSTVDWLRDHDYDVVDLLTARWSSDADVSDDVASTLDLPSYFGRNLQALADCLGDVAAGDYGRRSDATGLVLVLHGYDVFTSRRRSMAQNLLDIIADEARRASLRGHRLMCLIQTDDPRLSFDPVGATDVAWNPQEFKDSTRT